MRDGARVATEIVYEGRPGARVEVAGDLPDWRVPHALLEERPGLYRRTFALGPGVYRYKLLVDGAWTLDPRCPHVDRSEGVDNNLLVVGAPEGLPPGVFFAPDRRHVAALPGGGARVHVEVDLSRTGGVRPASLDLGGARVPLVEVLRRGDRAFLSGVAAAADGPPSSRAPAWLEGAVLYGIFLDRWRRGRASPPERRMLAPTTPSTPFVFYGGDLDGVREHLGYVADLGVTAVALTPVALSPSPHRYDAQDLFVVDPAVGGERALAALVEASHRRGLKLVLDASLTHVSEKHPAFRDLLDRQQASPTAPWFRVKRFPVVARDAATVELYFNCKDQPWLDLAGPAAEHALEAAVRLVEHGVDGLRLDAMDDAPPAFWAALRARVRATRDDVLLLGETVTDALWQRASDVDVVTDFRIRDALVAFVARRAVDARGFADAWAFAAFRTGPTDPSYRLGFVDNHDTARFLSLCGGDTRKLRIALAILLFSEETAWLTYGTEAHLAAHAGERALDNAWRERIAMPDPASVDTPTRAWVRALCAARRELRGRPVRVVSADGARLVLERGSRRLLVDVDGGEPVLS